MTEEHWTTGEWEFCKERMRVYSFDRQEDLAIILDLPQCGDLDAEREARANGNIMAAAPELLRAVNYMRNMIFQDDEGVWKVKPEFNPEEVLFAVFLAGAK